MALNREGSEPEKQKYNYESIFVTPSLMGILGDRIPEIPEGWNETKNKHISTSFTRRVPETRAEDIGTYASVTVDGYAFDRNALVLHVAGADCQSPVVQKAFDMAQKTGPVHITIAAAPKVKNRDSKAFESGIHYFDEPVEIPASFGGFTQEKTLDVLTPEEKKFKGMAENILSGIDSPLAEGMIAVSEKNPGAKTIYLKKTIDQDLAGPDNAGSDLGQLS
ncbi:MAG: hypothetical protein ACI4CS_05685, partial [Candidatus Weimeria sp.]